MEPHVNFESACSRIPFVAARNIAHERLLSGMRQLVSLEVSFGDKLLKALAAFERAFSGVSSHVRLKVARFGELLEAFAKGAEQDLFLVLGAFDPFELGLCSETVNCGKLKNLRLNYFCWKLWDKSGWSTELA